MLEAAMIWNEPNNKSHWDPEIDPEWSTVSHCDIIRGLIAYYLGLPLDNLLRFDIDPASVSRLVVGSWGARVMSMNERLYQ